MVPAALRGQWIWLNSEDKQVEEHLFFRREFALAEMPGSAEFWITARTGFQVFINGRHAAFGPHPCPSKGGNFLTPLEAGYYLQAGRNVIAVLADNTSVTRTSCSRLPGGLWCQLDLDGKPTVWSDADWKVHRADCYAANRPRRSAFAGFTESIDFRIHPHGWTEEGFEDSHWSAPDWIKPVSLNNRRILPSRISEVTSRYDAAEQVVGRGTWGQRCAMSFLGLAELVGAGDGGVYVARSFFRASRAGRLSVKIFGDNPYRLFLNGQCVREQGVPALRCGQPADQLNPPAHGEAGVIAVDGTLQVREGWNEVVVFELTNSVAAGMGFVFPDTSPGGIVFRRKPEEEADKGWTVAGPLKTPLPATLPDLDFDRLAAHPYTPELSAAVNEQALLHALRFQPDPEVEKNPGRRELRKLEYIVYDFGRTVHGSPTLSLEAGEADLLHVVTAEALDENTGIPHLRRADRQDIETIICDTGKIEWLAATPRSFRYLMLVTRDVEDTLALNGVGVASIKIDFSNRGAFHCDDETLNQIWQIGERTLNHTARGQFIDAPAGRREQALPDAMIQSWSAYFTLGTYQMATNSLCDFAESQYETGEILPVAPSTRYIRQPQFSLFWPLWVYQHYLYDGDHRLAERLVPHLDEYLAFLESQAGDQHLLQGLGEECTLRNFVDWTCPPADTVSTALNALYCRTLFTSARFFDLLGEAAAAHELRHRAAETGNAIRSLCWDGENEQFADFARDGQPGDSSSWVTQVLALYGGIVPTESAESVFSRFVAERELAQLGRSPLFKHILLQTAVQVGARVWACKHLLQYWGGMAAKGANTWWQKYDPALDAPPADAPLCYGAAALPNAFLCAEVVGLRPATPGFAAAYFNPLVQPGRHVTARIPTVHGHINVQWNATGKDEVKAHVHASYPLDLIPVFPPELEEKMTLHLSENVTLLVSNEE